MQYASLTFDEDSRIRIKDSRIPLETVVNQFQQGATAEQIQEDFPSLGLREIYGAIYYYLENTEAYDKYTREQEQAAAESVRLIDSHSSELRERLRVRRGQMVNP